MSVALDTTLVGTANGNGVNSLALSNFSTGGANCLVTVDSDTSNDTATISSVTATGLTFTLMTRVNKGTSQGWVEKWGAWAAAQQTNVAITVTYAGGFPQCAARTVCYSGTDASGTVAAATGAVATPFASTGSTAPTATLTTTRANSLVVGVVGEDGAATVTAGSGQTVDGSVASAGGFSTVASLYQNVTTVVTGSSVTMNATMGSSVPVGLLALEILAPPSKSFSRTGGIRPHSFSPGIAR